MVFVIDTDAPEFKNKLRTNEAKIGKKLRTASLNSKFSSSCKKSVV